jgi:hypothetical protein
MALPPYEDIEKDVQNLSEFGFVEPTLLTVKIYINKIYSLLDELNKYKHSTYSAESRKAIYKILDDIKVYAELLDETLLDIQDKVSKRKPEPADLNYGMFNWYIWRTQIEVAQDIKWDAINLQEKMRFIIDLSKDLEEFITNSKEKLRKLENLIKTIFKYTSKHI